MRFATRLFGPGHGGGATAEFGEPDAAYQRKDLKAWGLLESTLVIWGEELGRSDVVQVPAQGQGGTIGRDHHIDAFTVWIAGGGVRAGQTVGTTDEIGFNPVDQAIHVHDLQATIVHVLGMDQRKLTYHYQGRDSRLTDVGGEIVGTLVAS
jgi:Protein of unknown function (DUF1501)